MLRARAAPFFKEILLTARSLKFLTSTCHAKSFWTWYQRSEAADGQKSRCILSEPNKWLWHENKFTQINKIGGKRVDQFKLVIIWLECMKYVESACLGSTMNALKYDVISLSMRPYGCRTTKRTPDHSRPEHTKLVMDLLHERTELSAQYQYKYIIQHILESPKDKSRMIAPGFS